MKRRIVVALTGASGSIYGVRLLEELNKAASWFGVQAIVNLGGVTGLMPVTGLTLPFFSAGGSSLFVSMLAAGLLLSVARRVGERDAVTSRRTPL